MALPEADVLIHCGDATGRGTIEEFASFGNWFQSLPYTYKLFVPGNHDFLAEKNTRFTRELIGEYHCKNTKMLVDERYYLQIGNEHLKVYGSPWVPNLEGWAYWAPHLSLIKRFAEIPRDTNVLITHGPPWGLLDKDPVTGGAHHIGSIELAEARNERLGDLKLHCFGHIHEGYGVEDHLGGRYTVNASNCDIDYQLINPPIVVDITI